MTSRKTYFITLVILAVAVGAWLLNHLAKPIPTVTYEPMVPAKSMLPAKSLAEYRKKLKKQNPDNPELYYEIMAMRKTPSDLAAPAYPLNYKYNEMDGLQKNRINVRTKSTQWTSRGPGNVPGRTRAIVVLDEDASGSTWLAASVGGGIWYTDDAGQSWDNRTPDLPNLATTSLVRSVSNPNVFYAGTGESFASPGFTTGSNGDGMFKSTDGGQSFFQLANTANDPRFTNVNRVIVNPLDENIVLACTIGFISVDRPEDDTSYILKSTDGGASWTEVFQSEAEIQQLLAMPGDFNTLFASLRGSGIYKSIDQGETWEYSSPGLSSTGRIEMAISPANTNRIFAYAEGGNFSTDADLWISDDAGETWTLTREADSPQNVDNLLQGNFDNVIIGHPFDEDIAYFGGVDLFKTELVSSFADPVFTVSETLVNTSSFLDFNDFRGTFLNGGAVTGPVPTSQLKTVEIRFGPGVNQNAHQFTVPPTSGNFGNGSSGVPDEDYEYIDFVNVPFQAWDVSVVPERQLVISFRDQERNGQWDLTGLNDPDEGREYIFIHDLDYDAATPNTNVTVNGGHTFERMYFLWPISATENTINTSNLPTSHVRIIPSQVQVQERNTVNMSDSRNSFPNNPVNTFDQVGQFGTVSQEGGLHPDHHYLQVINANPTTQTFQVINGNDGGVYLSTPSTTPGEQDGSWVFSGSGYNTGQFYAAVKQPGADVYAGGLQDNGSWTSQTGEVANDNSQYVRSGFGDGFEASWNLSDGNLLIVSSQFNNFIGSLNAGQGDLNQTYAADFGFTDRGPFVSRLASSPQNPELIFTVGSQGVWKSRRFGLNLGAWELTPITTNWAFNDISDVEVSLADPSLVWAGGRMDAFGSFFVSTDGGDSFQEVEDYTTVTMGLTSGIFTHPTQRNTAYALFSFADRPKVLRTTDLGQTWEDISGFETTDESTNGFPDVAVNTLLVHPNEPNTIWVGTEIGIVESTNNGATWQLLEGNLPSAQVWQLTATEDRIIAATHGRGIWTTELSPALPARFIPNIVEVTQTTAGGLTILARYYEVYDGIQLFLDGELSTNLGVPTEPGLFVYNIPLNPFPTQDRTIELRIDGTTGGTTVSSIPQTIDIFGLVVRNQYATDFNNLSLDDFELSGFEIEEIEGFSDGALHSTHPYPASVELTAQLKVPIRVASPPRASIQFDNIALVETGGTANDFVIVEGSEDGINWEPVGPGYDAEENIRWRNALNRLNDPTEDLYETTGFRLTDTFDEGDTIFIRFRLFSDFGNPNDAAFWGWAIDNLLIQTDELVTSTETGIREEPLKIFPNPISNNQVHGQYFLSSPSEVTLEVVDLNGRQVASDALGIKLPGAHTFDIDLAGEEAGVYLVRLAAQGNETTLRVMKPD